MGVANIQNSQTIHNHLRPLSFLGVRDKASAAELDILEAIDRSAKLRPALASSDAAVSLFNDDCDSAFL
jgi:hypothetical protein